MPARPESIEAVHDLIAALWAYQPQLSAADRVRFEAAVIEIASNIVKHATAWNPNQEEVAIELTLTAGPDRITARFQDDGGVIGFDPSATAQMPDEIAEDGRGIALTQALVEHLSYERADATNVWTLSYRLTGVP